MEAEELGAKNGAKFDTDSTTVSEQASKRSKPLPEGWRPLSDAPVKEVINDRGETVRIGQRGHVLCHARRRDGELCKSPAILGMKVCRMHGGATLKARQGAKLRLMELVSPAIATLAREMTQADKSVDRQRAANSILDRSGFGRRIALNPEDVKEQLYAALLEAKTRQDEIEAAEIEEAEIVDDDGDDFSPTPKVPHLTEEDDSE